MTTTVHAAAHRTARPTRWGRLVKLDLLVAALALALILAVTAVDHLVQGDVPTLAGLLLG